MKEMETWEKELKETLLPEQDTEESQIQAERAFEKRVQRAINKRIRAICLRTIAVVAIVVCVVFLVVSPLLNVFFPSPKHLVRGKNVDLFTYLDAYYETVMPYAEVVVPMQDKENNTFDCRVRRQGFGCYDVDLDLADPRGDGWVHVGDVDATATLRFGKFKYNPGSGQDLMLTSKARFSGHGSTPEEVKNLIADYPKASSGYFNIRLTQPVALSDLKQSGADIVWMEVYNDETEDFRGGIRLKDRTNNGEQVWRQDLSEEELREQFLANLDTILSAPRMMESLGLTFEMEDDQGIEGYSGGFQTIMDGEQYFEAVRAAVEQQEGPLMTERIAIGGSRDELLEFLKRDDIQCVTIESFYLQKLG